MKYWKGLPGTDKEGQFGTYDDNGEVPDSEEVAQAEYQAWADAQPVTPHIDYKALYTAAANDTQRLEVLAKRLNIIP